ncbi:Nickel uptake substrate-specific transmembrane region [Planctomycetes bacterium Poly30]|uniref:Nickel uptake substrate-specific transmembrane region n=1 Tax=Saltatorellus ferox TaxID=2528018 RepID=A0A518EX18_9BACT|nr:Nickel uptake substrate-specific transmembrane region [Planctomycetes bacterium Poly30]
MKSKLFALLTVAALGVLALWYITRAPGAEPRADPGVAGEGSPNAGAAKDDEQPEVAELSAPVAPEGPSRESIAEVEALAETDGAEAALPTWDVEDTLWIEATVVLPEGTPNDEQAFVLAASEPMQRALALGDAGPFAALRDGREPRRIPGVLAAAQVGEEGTVRLALPPGTGEAWISVGGSYLYSLEPYHLVDVNSANPLTLRPALGARITGAVLTQDGRTGAEGVTVSLDWSLNSRLQLGSPNAGSLGRSTESKEQGRFDLFALPTGRPLAIQTRSDTFARSFSDDLQLTPGESRSVTLTLATGGTVHGRVVNEKGEPVPGTTVTALGREFFGNPTEDLREAETGEDGRFELAGVTPGKVWVRAEHDDYQGKLGKPFDLGASERFHAEDIVLDRGLVLSGKVAFPDGRPVSGAMVKADPDLGENAAGSPVDPRSFAGAGNDARTDETGAFEIAGLGEGPWAVTVEYDAKEGAQPEEPGRWTAFQSLVHAPAANLEFTLNPPVRFRGSVLNSAGEPLTSFEVKGERSGSQWYMPPSETRTRTFEPEDGRFVFADLRSGDWTFTVEAEGMARSEKARVTLPSTEESTFTLFAPIRLAGRVVDPNGLPVPGAEIAKELEGQESIQAMQGLGDWPSTHSDGEGLFALENIAPGAGSIVAKKDGWAASEGHAYELAEGEAREEIVLVMRRGGTISGEVFGADGEPAAGCVLILQMPTLEERRFANADGNGRFEEAGLTPGTWQVQAFPGIQSLQPEDGGALDQTALMMALKMTTVKLEDEAKEHVVLGSPPALPVRVHGTVSLAGEPVGDLIISFMTAEGGGLEGLKIGKTAKDGSYELVLDEPGDYLMTVQSPGAAGMQNSVEFRRRIPEAESHELDVSMPMGRIAGRVIGPDGAPSANTRVTLSMQSGQVFGTVMGGQYNETRTDKDGRYEILFVRPGAYAVAAGGSYLGGLLGDQSSPGREVKTLTVSEDSSATLDFELEAPGELHGVVRDAAGKPAAEASIFLRDENGRLLELFSFQATNASGAFEYDGLAPGEYTLTARAEGMASTTDTPLRIRSGEVTETSITVDTGTMLLVSLQDKTGADIRSRVSVRDEHDHEVNGMLSLNELMARISGGVDGKEQRVGPLPPGTYEVSCVAEDGRTATRRVRLTGKPEKKLRLRLE